MEKISDPGVSPGGEPVKVIPSITGPAFIDWLLTIRIVSLVETLCFIIVLALRCTHSEQFRKTVASIHWLYLPEKKAGRYYF